MDGQNSDEEFEYEYEYTNSNSRSSPMDYFMHMFEMMMNAEINQGRRSWGFFLRFLFLFELG